MARHDDDLELEDCKLIFTNFSGAVKQFNPDGKREFSILLSEEEAEAMDRDGWNIKRTREREVDDEMVGNEPFVTVLASYKIKSPTVVLITSRNRTFLDEEAIGMLDYADITNVDVVIRPSHWEVNGKKGIKAYLKAIYVTIYEDRFAQKYADIPTKGSRPTASDDD